jgi:hypothetical protein
MRGTALPLMNPMSCCLVAASDYPHSATSLSASESVEHHAVGHDEPHDLADVPLTTLWVTGTV